MKLFQIPQAINDVLAAAEDGELSPIVQEHLNALEIDLKTKVQSYCWLIAKYEDEIPHIRERAAQIVAKARAHESRIQWLKDQLKQTMVSLKTRSIDTDWYDVALVNNGGKPKVTVECDLETLRPPFSKTVVEIVADKDAIIKAWEEKKPLPDGVKVERGEHVRIS